LSNTATISYSWSEKGKQNKVSQKQRKRERKTVFGCVEPKTGIVMHLQKKEVIQYFFQFSCKSGELLFWQKSNNGFRQC
jgi:hypothetical protein